MFTDSYSKEAAILYCRQNQRLQPVLAVIQAIIDGMTPTEIITHRVAPTLSIRTVQYYYNKFKNEVK
ncbi:hypothetical protein [Vibrio diazotrophicus]|uniref:Uncharacterized protein n=1 Tax=Vibrio diazotrophicus TaxID=685 RepID=A0ABX4W8W5_VIBDI|nr:hypothetical protein [Vibrio diazotrophicus]PNI00206.1 hypothetical protein C1O25_12595 [Vibrio diazotrophicus]